MNAIPPYTVTKGRQPRLGRPQRRVSLDRLLALADKMETGDAVLLTSSEAQTFRTILAAKGFDCVTDGYASPDTEYPRRTCVFKLAKNLQ